MTNHLLIEAEKFHRRGEFDRAENGYLSFLKDNPADTPCLHALAILYAQLGNYKEAFARVYQALEINPHNATFHNTLGNLFLKSGEMDQAVDAYKNAIKKHPTYATPYNNLGNIYYRQEKYNAAKNAFDKAILYNPQFSDAYFHLSLVHLRQDEINLAVSHLQKALTLSPNSPKILSQLAEIYLEQELYDKAEPLLYQRLNLPPEDPNTFHSLALLHFQKRDYKKALLHFERALASNKHFDLIKQHIANTLLQLGDLTGALGYYHQQLSDAPTIETYYNIACILMMQERRKDAITYFDQVLAKDPNHLAAHVNMGNVYLREGMRSRAQASFQKALKIAPDDKEIGHILAALTQSCAPKKAPAIYTERLFDQYAPYYEQHLTQHLNYHVPNLLFESVTHEKNITKANWHVLDLGCGTGLCGIYFQNLANKLIGIDLSSNMLAIAKQKDLYHELIEQDIVDALSHFNHIDLIVAGDVLTYLGDLTLFFDRCNQALKKGGLLVFTVEKSFGSKDYILQETIRYAHHKSYITTLANQQGFKILRLDNCVIRKDHHKPIEGYLVLLEAGHHI